MGPRSQSPRRIRGYTRPASVSRRYDRTDLRRSPESTYVDMEGDVVWIQEYLRYRLNRCSHQQARDRVMQQIDRRGVAPVCE